MQRVRVRPANGNVEENPPQELDRRAETPVRNGRLLHSLQATAHPPDTDAAYRPEYVLQAEELQDGGVLRQEIAGIGS